MTTVGALGGSAPRAGGNGAPVRQASLRSHNLGVVLRAIFSSDEPISRARVAQQTGMTRSTVSRLTEELLAAQLICEHDPLAARGRGRPAVPLAPMPGTIAGMGLEINVDYLSGRIVDLAGTIVAEGLITGDYEDSDPAEVLSELGALGARLLNDATDAGLRIAGTCLALPGLVDAQAGRLLLAPNLGWRDVDPGPTLGAAVPWGTTVRVANEADVAGYAQAMTRPGHQLHEDTFLYVSGGIGVGSALVEHGRVADGQRGWAGEIGHMTIEPDGPSCHCGSRGCLERYAGIAAIAAAGGLAPSTTPAGIAAAAGTTPRVRAAVDRAGWALGIALAGAVNVVDVATVMLGAGYSPLFTLLQPSIIAELGRRVLSSNVAHVAVRPADRTVAAPSTGAAIRMLDPVLDDPAEWIDRASD